MYLVPHYTSNSVPGFRSKVLEARISRHFSSEKEKNLAKGKSCRFRKLYPTPHLWDASDTEVTHRKNRFPS